MLRSRLRLLPGVMHGSSWSKGPCDSSGSAPAPHVNGRAAKRRGGALAVAPGAAIAPDDGDEREEQRYGVGWRPDRPADAFAPDLEARRRERGRGRPAQGRPSPCAPCSGKVHSHTGSAREPRAPVRAGMRERRRPGAPASTARNGPNPEFPTLPRRGREADGDAGHEGGRLKSRSELLPEGRRKHHDEGVAP